MRNTLRYSLLSAILAVSAFMLNQPAMAGDDPIHTMANIMMHLEHYPSDSEKKTLQGISSSNGASLATKTLASAMTHLEHKVASADKPKLEAIVADANATANEKELAKIILNLRHMPSDADKEELKKMVK